MNTSPNRLVSVVIPTYNKAATLPQCIAAVRAQTYSPLEVIVVDDCSTDDSKRIAESLGVRVVSTPRNGGAGVARNTGAAVARGSVLFLLDTDAALAPDAVANAVDILDRDPSIGAVGGIEDPVPLTPGSLANDYRALQHHHWSKTGEGEVSFLWTVMCAIRADVFAEIGDFNPRLRQTEEVDYGERLSHRYRVMISTKVRGRLDFDRRLWTLLSKLFHRGRLRVPLYLERRRLAQGYETGTRALGALAAVLALLTLPLAAWLGGFWFAGPVLLLVAWLASDIGLHLLALRRRGPAFAGYVLVAHFLVSVVIVGSLGAGAVQWLASAKFRRLYAEPNAEPASAVR